MKDFLTTIMVIFIIVAIGAAVASIFYHLKRRELFGGYIGGLVVGVIGALIGGYVLDEFFYLYTVKILRWLAEGANFNIIFGFIGAFIAVYIMNKLNHDKERSKY